MAFTLPFTTNMFPSKSKPFKAFPYIIAYSIVVFPSIAYALASAWYHLL